MIYKTIKLLGRGGFGVVELVSDVNGSQYARKSLHIPSHLDAAQVKSRFEREVTYQSAIDHENVVNIFSYDLLADPPFFLMPLAVCNLADEMQADRSLGGDPKPALFDILAGLEEIHRRGYLHRDLKPANVLKFHDGGKDRYALSDFGLMAVGEDGVSTLTPSGMGGGTPRYQAPECATNFKRATIKSDIYSFGAILHDIFAVNPKRLPHDELTAPGDIGQIIEKCTKRNGHRRYKNVEELREALFQALNTVEFSFISGEEAEITGFLTSEEFPTDDQWDRIFGFLDDHEQDLQGCGNIFRALRREHIDHLHIEQPDLLSPLGKQFADYCRILAFPFDYCDVLASKAQSFYDLGDTQLKASIAVAMLRLGTSHNRWFVEHKFMQMAGPTVTNEVADRIAVELDVLKISFDKEVRHLELSISAQRGNLHPNLRQKLT